MNQFYAELDANGLPIGFYTSDIFPDVVEYGTAPAPSEADPSPAAPEVSRARNAAIPAGAVEITAAQWQECVQNPGERRWDSAAGAFVAFEPPPPVIEPRDISDRQFARGLWGAGVISYADFLGFIGPGTVPAAMQAIVETLPDDDTGAPTPRKEAIGFLTGARTFQFSHPLVETFRAAMAAQDAKWTPDFLRSQWIAWASL